MINDSPMGPARRWAFLFLLFLIAFEPAFGGQKDLAVIFDGPKICEGCADLFSTYMKKRGLRIAIVKPGGSTRELLSQALVYIVPGGEDVTDLSQAWSQSERDAIRDFVSSGGRYYGVCLGGYWAGNWLGSVSGFKGLDLIGAKVKAHSPTPEDRIEKINWLGQTRFAYFQDGPEFELTDPTARVLGRYSDGSVAAFIEDFGKGRVAVNGVHFEAPRDWYEFYHLTDPDGLDGALLDDLFDQLLLN